jgi:PAS domain S-box-containing protein
MGPSVDNAAKTKEELCSEVQELRQQLDQAQALARDNEALFRQVADHISSALWVCDAINSQILYVNRTYEKVFGQPPQALLQDPRCYLAPIHPEDRALASSLFDEPSKAGQSEVEFRVVRSDQSIRWVWGKRCSLQNAEGVTYRHIGIDEDVTERKAALELASKLTAIVEGSDDAILSIALDGAIMSWNPGAEKVYGYTGEEIIGKPFSTLFAAKQADEMQSILTKIRNGERVRSFETSQRRKNGRIIDVSITISPLINPMGRIVGASSIAHDVTEKKLLEEQFRQAQKMQAIGVLAGGVAHDFNNLLTVISGFSDMIYDALPPGDVTRDLVSQIRLAGDRAASLTRQLLAFSRRSVLRPSVLDLNAIVSSSERMLHRLLGEDIELTSALAPGLGRVRADAGQIEQIIINLAVNARDAMPEGGKLTFETANVELDANYCQTHSEVAPGPYVMLAVSDNGCGMTKETQARIFEPFFTTKEPGRGTGLGLAMVFGVIKQSGGHIGVYSELKQGTTIKIYLPRTWELATPSLAPPVPMPKGNEKVLLVEDEEGVRTLARLTLERCGYTILVARDGAEAVQIAEKHPGPIHLLITDVVMPGMGGQKLAEAMALCKPGIKALFMSGYTDDAVVRHGILHSEVPFLQKPFTPETIAQMVRKVLDAPVRPV